jgi:hypothetical protein
MKDYNKIYASGSAKANSLLKEAESNARQAKVGNQSIEELTALVSLQIAERKKFNQFNERYNKVINNEKVKTIMGDMTPESSRDVYQTGKISLNDGINIEFEELEAILSLDALKKNFKGFERLLSNKKRK